MTDAATGAANGPPRPLRRPVVGEVVDLGTRRVPRAEVVEFAERWDAQWFHVDADAARHGRFGDVIASGVHTIALFQQLAVAAVFTRWDLVAGRGFRDVRFRRPLRPDTTVGGTVEVVSIDPGRAHDLLVVAGRLHEPDAPPGSLLEITLDVVLGPGGH